MTEQNKKLLLLASSFSLILLTILSIAYAFFSVQIKGNESTSSVRVIAGKLELTLDGTLDFSGTGVLNTNTSLSKTFTVTNTGTETIENYNIYFSNLTNEFINDELVYTLTCTSYINYGIASQAVSGSCSGKSETPVPHDQYLLITSTSIAENITHEYVLNVTFKETGSNQDYNAGAKFSTKITVNQLLENPNYHIRGYVVDENGDYVPNTTVEIQSDPVISITNNDGYFALNNINPGSHTVYIKENDVIVSQKNIIIDEDYLYIRDNRKEPKIRVAENNVFYVELLLENNALNINNPNLIESITYVLSNNSATALATFTANPSLVSLIDSYQVTKTNVEPTTNYMTWAGSNNVYTANSEGLYYLWVKQDNGNVYKYPFTIEFDKIAPVITLGGEANLSTINSNSTLIIPINVTELETHIVPADLLASDIKVLINNIEINPTKVLTYNTVQNGVYSYTLTITNVTSEGNLTLKILSASVTDIFGNNNILTNLDPNVSVDNNAPTGNSILINSGATYTNIATVNVNLSSNGASNMCLTVSNSSAGCSWVPYSGTSSYTLSAGDGTKTIYAFFKDAIGNISSVVSDSIILDTIPPNHTININSGATYTTTRNVTITNSCVGNGCIVEAIEMCLTVSNSSTGCSWVPYSETSSYTLSAGDGTKTIYAFFKDAIGNISSVVNDSIILDTTAPTNNSISINDGDNYTTSVNVTLTLGSTGASTMCLATANSIVGCDWEPYVSSKSYTLTNNNEIKNIYAFFKDNAGNISEVVSDAIILDSNAPTISNVVANVTGSDINITVTASDNGGIGITNYLYSLNGVDYIPSADANYVFLNQPSGSYVVYVKVKDGLNQETNPPSTANVTISQYTLTVNTNNASYGKINGSSSSNAIVDYGETATVNNIAVTASPDYKFVKVLCGDATPIINYTSGTISINNMTTNVSCTAYFTPLTTKTYVTSSNTSSYISLSSKYLNNVHSLYDVNAYVHNTNTIATNNCSSYTSVSNSNVLTTRCTSIRGHYVSSTLITSYSCTCPNEGTVNSTCSSTGVGTCTGSDKTITGSCNITLQCNEVAYGQIWQGIGDETCTYTNCADTGNYVNGPYQCTPYVIRGTSCIHFDIGTTDTEISNCTKTCVWQGSYPATVVNNSYYVYTYQYDVKVRYYPLP